MDEPLVGHKAIEQAAIDWVMALERAAGREPRDTRLRGAPADVESPPRVIEVKAFGGSSRGFDLWLEPRQVEEARRNPNFHVYVVENVGQRDPQNFILKVLEPSHLLRLLERAKEQRYYTVPWPVADYDACPTTVDGLDDIDYVREALAQLTATPLSIFEAEAVVPPRPGLYAVHGSAGVWGSLGLGDPPDERPLYIGKTESSLISRDLRTHFGGRRTGWSTLRRSLAALLREELSLRAVPRNPAKPERFANYGLPAELEDRLTAWMRDSLKLAIWPTPEACQLPLASIELEILEALLPPLNISGISTPWTARVKRARASMAEEAHSAADGEPEMLADQQSPT